MRKDTVPIHLTFMRSTLYISPGISGVVIFVNTNAPAVRTVPSPTDSLNLHLPFDFADTQGPSF